MGLENDTRGWIMTCISGVACVLGASIICVDIFVRLFPRMHNFSIAESDAFLSASLSLSFGVMLFSALFSMLPQSKTYLMDGGFSPRGASFMLIGLFLAGVAGIQVLSNVLHHFLPSHIVDCDHKHGDEEDSKQREEATEETGPDMVGSAPIVRYPSASVHEDDEDTPLLSRINSVSPPKQRTSSRANQSHAEMVGNGFVTAPSSRRSSFMPRIFTRTFSGHGSKKTCDDNGPCMGYSDPCGQNCFKALQKRGSLLPTYASVSSRAPTWRSNVQDLRIEAPISETTDSSDTAIEGDLQPTLTRDLSRTMSEGDLPPSLQLQATITPTSHTHHHEHEHGRDHQHHHDHHNDEPESKNQNPRGSVHSTSPSTRPEHHHHVPTNAFMAIGLQTSIAIALHKAPEGFITYATNHANPTLGFAVFMALFIHNITEGFAMSLPLFLALNSRLKAILWSSILGGISQPLGAGVAVLWFKLASGNERGGPSEGVYGGMFAVTAGVMTSVALSLFSESLTLSHNRNICIAFAFLGMGILGISSALTAK